MESEVPTRNPGTIDVDSTTRVDIDVAKTLPPKLSRGDFRALARLHSNSQQYHTAQLRFTNEIPSRSIWHCRSVGAASMKYNV